MNSGPGTRDARGTAGFAASPWRGLLVARSTKFSQWQPNTGTAVRPCHPSALVIGKSVRHDPSLKLDPPP